MVSMHASTITETVISLYSSETRLLIPFPWRPPDSNTAIIVEQIKSALVTIQQARPVIFYCTGQCPGAAAYSSSSAGDINEGFVGCYMAVDAQSMNRRLTDLLESKLRHASEKRHFGYSRVEKRSFTTRGCRRLSSLAVFHQVLPVPDSLWLWPICSSRLGKLFTVRMEQFSLWVILR